MAGPGDHLGHKTSHRRWKPGHVSPFGCRPDVCHGRQLPPLRHLLHNLLPHLSALDNVEIAMVGTGLSQQQQRERAHELNGAVDLDGRGQRRSPELPRGERQRVAIARALANRPHLLLADEPTGNLDSDSVRRVLELLDGLRERERLTIVIVTHDHDEYGDAQPPEEEWLDRIAGSGPSRHHVTSQGGDAT